MSPSQHSSEKGEGDCRLNIPELWNSCMIQFLLVNCWVRFSSETVGLFHGEGRSVPESQIVSGVRGVCKERQNVDNF